MGGVIANPFLTALTGKAAKRSVAAAAAWMVVRREVMIYKNPSVSGAV